MRRRSVTIQQLHTPTSCQPFVYRELAPSHPGARAQLTFENKLVFPPAIGPVRTTVLVDFETLRLEVAFWARAYTTKRAKVATARAARPPSETDHSLVKISVILVRPRGEDGEDASQIGLGVRTEKRGEKAPGRTRDRARARVGLSCRPEVIGAWARN